MHKLLFTQLFCCSYFIYNIFFFKISKWSRDVVWDNTNTINVNATNTRFLFFRKRIFHAYISLHLHIPYLTFPNTHTSVNTSTKIYIHTHILFFKSHFFSFQFFSFKKRRKMCFQCCDPLCLVLHSHTFLHNEFSTR